MTGVPWHFSWPITGGCLAFAGIVWMIGDVVREIREAKAELGKDLGAIESLLEQIRDQGSNR